MSLHPKISNSTPVVFIDPRFAEFQSEGSSRDGQRSFGIEIRLRQHLRKVISRRVWIHVVGAESFKVAHEYIFGQILKGEYSDREDLNINLFDVERFEEIEPSSITCFGTIGSIENIGIDPIKRCLDSQIAFMFQSSDREYVASRIRSRSINKDPMIVDVMFHCDRHLSLAFPI